MKKKQLINEEVEKVKEILGTGDKGEAALPEEEIPEKYIKSAMEIFKTDPALQKRLETVDKSEGRQMILDHAEGLQNVHEVRARVETIKEKWQKANPDKDPGLYDKVKIKFREVNQTLETIGKATAGMRVSL